jgi:adenosylmethionine-8-amino-7-oxononanoate aminotransferase
MSGTSPKTARDSLQIWHPYTRAGVDPAPLRIARGEGAWLITEDERRILDGISSWWVNLHGHAHPRIAEAVATQAEKLEHVLLAGFSHEPAERLAQALRQVVPAGLEHIFFSDNGSTAVEVALKMALQYWRNVGRAEKREIVAIEHGYHGDTAGAMSVSDDSPFTEAFAPMRFPVHRANSAYCYRCPVGLKRESCHIECGDSLEMILREHGEKIAAIIVEPLLQGAGGMIVHPVEFLQRICALAVKYDVLLIADEVLTGFGRCGVMFACELAGITPDLMCLSKGLTGGFLAMGATLANSRIHDAFTGVDPARTFWHGHSYTGNPLACAAAVASLEIFQTEPVFDRINSIAQIHTERLSRLANLNAVGDTRQIGSVAAIELRADDAGYLSALRPKLYQFFLDRGVLLRPLGNVIYVLPPYCISSTDLNHIYDLIEQAVETIH